MAIAAKQESIATNAATDIAHVRKANMNWATLEDLLLGLIGLVISIESILYLRDSHKLEKLIRIVSKN